MNKTVLITGAGHGLGFSLVQRHLELKDKIYAFAHQMTAELKKLAENSDLLIVKLCNLASDESVAAAAKDVLDKEKQLDIVYNVAGVNIAGDGVGIAETNMDICMKMYDINALGALRICQGVWPLLQKGSLVMNISSESGSIGGFRRKREYGYSMSKAAMNMASKILSNELWEREARVMVIHPGWMRTAMGGEAAANSSNSVSPDESAENIVNIALNINDIPRDQMFMGHTGVIFPW